MSDVVETLDGVTLEFPSPRGDKLCQVTAVYNIKKSEFPSPRGDKLCLVKLQPVRNGEFKFPSPRGDKLCLKAGLISSALRSFPSPRGDKLCRYPIVLLIPARTVSVPSRG